MNNDAALSVQIPGRKQGTKAMENQDRLLIRCMQDGDDEVILLGVSDGISQCSYGGSVARWIIERHLATDEWFKPGDSIGEALPSYLSALYQTFQAEFVDFPDMLDSGATVSVAAIHGEDITCCWVGDSPIFLLTKTDKSYIAQLISRPDLERVTGKLSDCFGKSAPCVFKTATLKASPGCVLVVATDGAKLDEGLLAGTLEQGYSQA